MADLIPKFQHTSLDSITLSVATLRATFAFHKTKSLQFRLVQLRRLYWGLRDNEAAICEALKRDLGKSEFESYVGEIEWCKNDILFMCANLQKWAKDESPADIPFLHSILNAKIRKEPLGCVLIIGPHNVPFQLTLVPLVGAIAAGNTAVIKPSEATPASSALIQSILARYLDPSCYTCIQGAVAETTALLEQKWDKIFFTGSVKVAKIVAQKASETLTPYTLELGGRNPAIVTKNANLRLAARRLLWGKFHNAGQICVSQNVILVEKSALLCFLGELEDAMKEFYPNGAKHSSDFGRIVNQRQWERLRDLIQSTRGKVIMGGSMDEADKFIEPTVVQIQDQNDPLMLEENFGPIITVMSFESVEEAIRIARTAHSTPLAIYPFGTKQETDYILNELQSGGASVNDGWIHCTVPTMAFGGIGDSGAGSYRGRASFECFTHRRAVTTTPRWAEGLLGIRYPPYRGKLSRFKGMTSLEPDFDREGNPKGRLAGLTGALWAGGMRFAAMTSYAFTLIGPSGGSKQPEKAAA